MRLHEKLEKLRAQTNMSRADVAKAVAAAGAEVEKDVTASNSTVKRWEEGKTVPDLTEAAILARLYGVSVDFLADDAQDEPEPGLTPEEVILLRMCRRLGVEFALERLMVIPEGAPPVVNFEPRHRNIDSRGRDVAPPPPSRQVPKKNPQ